MDNVRDHEEAINNPKTPQELLLALYNPNSWVYKAYIQLIILQFTYDEVLCKLLIRWTKQLAEEKNWADAVTEDEIEAIIAKEKERTSRYAEQGSVPITSTKVLDEREIKSLEKLATLLPTAIEEARSEITAIDKELVTTRQKIDAVDERWLKRQDEKLKVFESMIENETIKFHDSDNKVVNLPKENIGEVVSALNLSPPAKLLRVNPHFAMEQHKKLEDEQAHPTRGKKLKSIVDIERGKREHVCHINVLGKLCELLGQSFSPRHIMKLEKTNPNLGKMIHELVGLHKDEDNKDVQSLFSLVAHLINSEEQRKSKCEALKSLERMYEETEEKIRAFHLR